MTFTLQAESTEDALLESLAYFADDLIERASNSGHYNPKEVKEQILWTVSRALGDMDSTHF
jgi:hypothetical protein